MIHLKVDQKELSPESITQTYVDLLESVSNVLSIYGLKIKPYNDIKNLHFLNLNFESQLKTIDHFGVYAEVVIETHKSHTLKDSKVLLWNMLKRLGYYSMDDVFTKIKDHHIIEIYNSQNVQIFRNLSFFKICSYSLDEILSIPWWKLYSREDKISQEIFKFGSLILSGEIDHSIEPEIPTHILCETASSSNYKVNIEINCMSGLTDHIGSRAALVLETAHLV